MSPDCLTECARDVAKLGVSIKSRKGMQPNAQCHSKGLPQ